MVNEVSSAEEVAVGLATARADGLVTVALTGKAGGLLAEHAQYCICVPSDATARIQEAHILIGHILCEIIDAEFVPQD